MRYLFFDIECSDGCHICSFGYCITDEQFKVIKKEDIVINPESKFRLSKRNNRPKINLAYSEDYFKNQKNFSFYYQKIKEILTEENQILCGHSILSDFHFLLNACDRYDLPKFQLKGFDIQKLHQIYYRKEHVQSLESILNDLKINVKKIKFHKSCDDAFATMLVAKRICKDEGRNFLEIINNNQNCIINGENLKLKKKTSSFKKELQKIKQNYYVENKKLLINK